MDVTLPNGQVISNVPDGTSKADLVAKLQRNGIDTSWYKPDDKSYLKRIGTESLPAIANMMGPDALGMAVGGLAGLMTADPNAVAGVSEAMRERLPRFGDKGVERVEEVMGEGIETLKQKSGSGLNTVGSWVRQKDSPQFQDPLSKESLELDNRSQLLGGVGIETAPLPGGGLITKGVRAAGKYPSIRAARRAEAEKLTQELSAKMEIASGLEPKKVASNEPPLEFDTRGSTPLLEASLDESTSPGATPFVKNDSIPFTGRAELDPNFYEYADELGRPQRPGQEITRQNPGTDPNRLAEPYFDRLEMEQKLPANPDQPLPTREGALYDPTWPGENLPPIKRTSPDAGAEMLSRDPLPQARSPLRPQLTQEGLAALQKRQKGSADLSSTLSKAIQKLRDLQAKDPVDENKIAEVKKEISDLSEDINSKERWQVIYRKDGRVVHEYSSKKRAQTKLDQLDNEHGAYRYGMYPKPKLGGPGKKQGGAFMPFLEYKRELKAKGVKIPHHVAKALHAKYLNDATPAQALAHPDEHKLTAIEKNPGLTKIREQFMDERKLEELPIDPSKDLTSVGKHVVDKIINHQYVAKDNPIVSWASSNINRIGSWSEALQNKILHGKSAKQPDPGTYNYVWKQLTVKERAEVKDVMIALNNEQEWGGITKIQSAARDVLGRELTDKQLAAYVDRVNINKKLGEMINTELRAEGREPMNLLPHFATPAEFDGPFLLIFRKEGETPMVFPSYMRPKSGKIESLKKDFPGYEVDVKERTLGREFDFDQYIEILRMMSDPTRTNTTNAIREALRLRGFMRHGQKREGAKGYMGTEKETWYDRNKGLHNYEQVSERYIRSAVEYMKNRQLDKLFSQLSEFEPAKQNPLAHAYSLEAIDQARGGSNVFMEKSSAVIADVLRWGVKNGTFKQVDLPQVFLRDLMNHANKAKIALVIGFGFPIQIAIQGFQPLMAIPKLLDMGATHGFNFAQTDIAAVKAASRAMMKYATDHNGHDIQKLREIGAFESTFRYDWSNYAGDRMRDLHKSLSEHLSGMSTLSYIESNAVRKPAALTFLEMLREMGHPETPEIYEMAKLLTDKYMVTAKYWNKPAALARSGLAGQIMGPLQNFPATWLAQLREYSMTAAKKPTSLAHWQPIIAFLTLTGLLSGTLGIIGVKETDALINFMNEQGWTDIKTPSEFIYERFKSKSLRYGVVSSMVGANVGASMNAPTVTGSFAPGLQFIGSVLRTPYHLMRTAGVFGEENKPTKVEHRDILKEFVPRTFHKDVEDAFTPEGHPIQKSMSGSGSYRRDEEDQLARRFGTFSLKEADEKNTNNIVKQKGMHRQKILTKAMNHIGDALLTQEDPKPVLEHMYRRLVEEGFDDRQIRQALKAEIKSKILTEREIKQGRLTTAKQAYFYNLYQNLGPD